MNMDLFNNANLKKLIATILILLFVIWFFEEYLSFPTRPGNDVLYPLGWFGWFDQGHYLRAESAIGRLDLSATEHHYPPLYPFFAYIGDFISKTDRFLTIDAVCFVIYMASLLWVGTLIYGVVIWIVPVALFYYYPDVTLDQWVIPWTTSLSAALQGIMVAVYVGFDHKSQKFALESKSDLAFVFVFFLAYGAIFATRPLEVLVFFPLALSFFIKALWPLVISGHDRRSFYTLRFLIVVALGGIAFPISYLMFNRIVFGEWLGGYLSTGAEKYARIGVEK